MWFWARPHPPFYSPGLRADCDFPGQVIRDAGCGLQSRRGGVPGLGGGSQRGAGTGRRVRLPLSIRRVPAGRRARAPGEGKTAGATRVVGGCTEATGCTEKYWASRRRPGNPDEGPWCPRPPPGLRSGQRALCTGAVRALCRILTSGFGFSGASRAAARALAQWPLFPLEPVDQYPPPHFPVPLVSADFGDLLSLPFFIQASFCKEVSKRISSRASMLAKLYSAQNALEWL